MLNIVRTVFTLSSAFLAIAVALSTLEYLAILSEFDVRGAFSWRILGTRSARPRIAIVRALREASLGHHGIAIVLLVRLACVLVLVLGLVGNVELLSFCGLGGILLSSMLLTYRCAFGTDGSDQMSVVVSVGLLVAGVPSNSLVWPIVGFGFIAFQGCLSYITAGIAKAISPVWRNGTALYKIMNTGAYGHAAFAEVLRGTPSVSFIMCWSVIIFETIFPLSLAGITKVTFSLFAIGILFHLGNAIFMGLNAFLWSFMATYPAIWFIGRHFRVLLHSRS